ncbi:MAG: class I SAM-dependent methyltransferase [Candidatus Cloacimonetes bacterium]|nr:class I SAM-dependent methyltransferase [Candidatus Cloacimonadota bacterium]MDD2506977.1 class I SAM-dependent methyltransferase [Candidatus Cloacimonadota bacterium]MDD4147013.1 class I SAM-dependent methyltransferase [Candidatus Cloacimonadota bacterium]MDD4560488.1 class I SAM-dependent methyltransferase [Candidatus Cloacimonadota bacterium]
MKLRLYVEKSSQAEALRFAQLKEHNRWKCLEKGCAIPLYDDGIMDVALSFGLAESLWGDIPQLHICRQFALVYLPGKPSLGLVNLLRGLSLYAFDGEEIRNALPASIQPKRIAWLQEFYAERNNSKALVSSRKDLIRTILAGSPLSFTHFMFHESAVRMCLGAELWAYRGDALRGTLAVAEDICEKLEVGERLSLFFVQSCMMASGAGSYGFFADRYDRYMAHVDYDKWFELLKDWQRTYSGGVCKRVLELACGTAAVASRFVREGAEVYACDLSAQMLENAAKRPIPPHLYQASLIDPIPHKDFDLIICIFDSINYLVHPSEVRQCLVEVKQALAQNGLFIFDISTLLNSMENFSDECSLTRERDGIMVHEAYYEPGKRHQVSRLELFQEWGAGYIHRSEKHSQRVYLAREILDLIADAGLVLRAIHSPESKANLYPKKMQGIDHRNYRLFFIVSK